MSTFEKIIVPILIIACFCFIGFGSYEIIDNGFEYGKNLLAQLNPLVVGSTTLFVIYDRYFARKMK